MDLSKVTRRKFIGYSLLGGVAGLFGLKILGKAKEQTAAQSKTSVGKAVRKFTPYTYPTPAPVYFTRIKDNEPLSTWAEKAQILFQKAGFAEFIKKGKLVAVKQHFGEKGNEGYIKPEITRKIVDEIVKKEAKPTLIETNTLYVGSRANSFDHMLTAYEHGFTLEKVGAPVLICDGINGQNQQAISIPGKHFESVYIASDVFFFDSLITLSHVKGHMMTGMGGAIKNLGMGLASRAGKLAQHADFKPIIDRKICNDCGDCVPWCPAHALYMENGKLVFDKETCIGCGECLPSCKLNAISFSWDEVMQETSLIEKMTEHALGGIANFGGKMGYMNFVNHIGRHCDCYGQENHALFPDIGIFASADPVAVDAASYLHTKQILGKDIFQEMWPKVDGYHTFTYAESLGMGTTKYELIEV